MSDHRCALSAASPIAARPVLARRKCPSIRLRTSENVVTIGRVANTRNYGAPFGQRSLHAEFVVVAVKVIHALRNDIGFEVLPRAMSNAIAGVNGLCACCSLGAEIRTPSLATRTHRLRQCLAMAVRALNAAENLRLCPVRRWLQKTSCSVIVAAAVGLVPPTRSRRDYSG